MNFSVADRVKCNSRNNIPVEVRREIISRQHNRCASCDERLELTFNIDHITPLRYGGTDQLRNLHALCPNCHARKTREEPAIIRSIEELKKENPSYVFCWRCGDIYSAYFPNHQCTKDCWFADRCYFFHPGEKEFEIG